MSWLSSVFQKVNVSSVLGLLGVGSGHPAAPLLGDLLSSALPTVVEDLLKSLGGQPAKPGDLSTLEKQVVDQAKALGIGQIEKLSDLSDDHIRAVCAETGGNADAAIAARPTFLQAEAGFLTPLIGG